MRSDVSGNGAFWKMLAELRRRYAFRAITTDQFRQLCAEFMPPNAPDRQLVDFFDQWVSSTGVPKLKLSSKVTKTPHGNVVSGMLTQTDVPEDFSADFPVTIMAGGSPVIRWIHSSSQDADFQWTFNQSVHFRGARSGGVVSAAVTAMIPWFIATEQFTPECGKRWDDYIRWSGLTQLEEVVSLDGISARLCWEDFRICRLRPGGCPWLQ